MTHTDADLERAARRLCEMRGKDPELLLEWMIDELRSHLEREEALREVRGEQQRAAFGKAMLEFDKLLEAEEQATNSADPAP